MNISALFRKSSVSLSRRLSDEQNTTVLEKLQAADQSLFSYMQTHRLNMDTLLHEGETVLTKAIKLAQSGLVEKEILHSAFKEENKEAFSALESLKSADVKNRTALIHFSSQELLEKLNIPSELWPSALLSKAMLVQLEDKKKELIEKILPIDNKINFIRFEEIPEFKKGAANNLNQTPKNLLLDFATGQEAQSKKYTETDQLLKQGKISKDILEKPITAAQIAAWISEDELKKYFEWVANYNAKETLQDNKDITGQQRPTSEPYTLLNHPRLT